MNSITVHDSLSNYNFVAVDRVVTEKSLMDRLGEPFRKQDLKWRLQRCGQKDGNIWAIAIVYVTSRAVQERLDEVVGCENWQNQYINLEKGSMCGISIKINGEWITKWDGAENTEIEPFKGGISGAFKRAAVPWNIGRYLYRLKETFIKNIEQDRKFKNKTGWEAGRTPKANGSVNFYWEVPALDPWALHSDDSIYIDSKLQDMIRAYISDTSISISDFRKAFSVKDASNIKKTSFNECLDWIEQYAVNKTTVKPARLI